MIINGMTAHKFWSRRLWPLRIIRLEKFQSIKYLIQNSPYLMIKFSGGFFSYKCLGFDLSSTVWWGKRSHLYEHLFSKVSFFHYVLQPKFWMHFYYHDNWRLFLYFRLQTVVYIIASDATCLKHFSPLSAQTAVSFVPFINR